MTLIIYLTDGYGNEVDEVVIEGHNLEDLSEKGKAFVKSRGWKNYYSMLGGAE